MGRPTRKSTCARCTRLRCVLGPCRPRGTRRTSCSPSNWRQWSPLRFVSLRAPHCSRCSTTETIRECIEDMAFAKHIPLNWCPPPMQCTVNPFSDEFIHTPHSFIQGAWLFMLCHVMFCLASELRCSYKYGINLCIAFFHT